MFNCLFFNGYTFSGNKEICNSDSNDEFKLIGLVLYSQNEGLSCNFELARQGPRGALKAYHAADSQGSLRAFKEKIFKLTKSQIDA